MEIRQLSVAEKALAQDHLQLVQAIARRMARAYPRFAPQEDLEAHGMVGLLRAAYRYVAGGEATFATYAAYRIRGAMLDALKQIAPIPRAYELPQGDALDDDIYGLVEMPEPTILAGIDGKRARAAIAKLPAMERRLLRLVYFAG